MKEKEILDLVIEELERHHSRFVVWRAPSFKNMRWDILGCFDMIVVWNYTAADTDYSRGNENDCNIWFIQATTIQHLSDRRKKIMAAFADSNFAIPNSFIYAWDEKHNKFKIEKL